MAEYNRGINTEIEGGSRPPIPVATKSGVVFAVGTAPVYKGTGAANEVYMFKTWEEAVSVLGYSDDWETYDLCRAMYYAFQEAKVSPVFAVNVLDPAVHRTSITTSLYAPVRRVVRLGEDAIASTVVVKSQDTITTYTLNTDYALNYKGGDLLVEVLPGGAAISESFLSIGFSCIDASTITEDDYIGGVDLSGKETGLELIRRAYPKHQVNPDALVFASGAYTADTINALAAKTDGINGLFRAKAFVDVNVDTARKPADVAAWKAAVGASNPDVYAAWLKPVINGKAYPASTVAAFTVARTDAGNDGYPTESPSNKEIPGFEKTVLGDGTEILLDAVEAKSLNAIGIATFLRMAGRFTLFGNNTTIFPDTDDPVKYSLATGRTFSWVANRFITSYWRALDTKMNRRRVDSLVEDENYFLSGLARAYHIPGAAVSVPPEDNPIDELEKGRIVFLIRLGAYPSTEYIEARIVYDVQFLRDAFGV